MAVSNPKSLATYHGDVSSQTAPTLSAKSSKLPDKMGSVPALHATNSSATFDPIHRYMEEDLALD